MGRADEAAIRSGTRAEVLMERAGQAVARAALALLGGRYGRRAVVVCGKGNNGGDGYVAARALATEGVAVSCYPVDDPSTLRGAPRHHFELYRVLGGRLSHDPHVISDADVTVDAIFGTGFRASADGLGGPPAEAIDVINKWARAVVAVDIPSGVDGATGAVRGPAVKAQTTVVMAAEKMGTAIPPGALHAGRVQVVDIGIPVDAYARANVLPSPRTIPRRDPTAHKRSEGSAVLLAGSDAMQGAALLTVRGAQRAGAGYVTLGTTAAVKVAAHVACPEALVNGVDAPALGPDALDVLAGAIERADAVGVGPGIGTDPPQRALVERILAEVDVSVVLDADALNVLARDTSPLTERSGRGGPVVITPHPAELARLLGTQTADVQADRVGAARTAAERFGAVVVLKGWRSVVVAPDGRAEICPTGGPELATAGTGDVLTGAVTGLGGGHDGARAGVFVHGLAGTIAGERGGRSGVVAWDVAEMLPRAWERIAAGEAFDWLV
jgi:hydroxyethylthiazole kinase-like uncharacterized protein yjeF